VNRLFATRFNHVGYLRPRSASPVKVPLVPAFRPCTSPDETHGPPLAFPSCSGPVQRSTTVTVGTPDANGHPAGSVGSVGLRVVPGNTGSTTNEADVLMSVSVTDVRKSIDRSDYAGELEAVAVARITDREPAPTEFEPSTLEDFGFGAPVPCTATPDTIGATCATQTSFNAIIPGSVVESTRAVWQLGQVQVFDGGADGDIGTAPNAVFAVQGVFVP